jgi:hypothetical protein
MIQQYAYVQHMKTALGTILRGEEACDKLIISTESNDDDFELPIEFVFSNVELKKEKVKEKLSGLDILRKLKQEGLFNKNEQVDE